MLIGTVGEIWRYAVKSMGGERLGSCTLGPLGIPGDRGWCLRDETVGEMRGAKKMPALMLCSARYVDEPSNGTMPQVEITLADGSRLRSDAPEAANRLSEAVGRPVTLWPRQPSENAEHYRRRAPDDPDFERELRALFGRLPDEPLPDLSVFPAELFEFTSPRGTYFDAFPLHLLTTASLRHLSELNPRARFDRRRFRPNFLIETADELGGLVEADWSGRHLRIGSAVLKLEVPCVRCVMTTLEQPELPKDPSVLRTIVGQASQNLGVYASVVATGRTVVGDPVELL